MSDIIRLATTEEWAHAGIIKAGDYCFLGYCVGYVGGTTEQQVQAAFDDMERKLSLVGLTLTHVVKMDCMFLDIREIPVMEKMIRERFHGKYPVRKSFQTAFAGDGLRFQADAIAYIGKGE